MLNNECTMCGMKDIPLTTVGVEGETQVCESCLDSFYVRCDSCGEYWLDDPDFGAEMIETEDGRMICPHCAG